MDKLDETGVALCFCEEEVRADELGSGIEDDTPERRVLRDLSKGNKNRTAKSVSWKPFQDDVQKGRKEYVK